ncbi:hypothetical protein BDV93DRAFT_527131, partial [Ceratobasidium sp. AG-I]
MVIERPSTIRPKSNNGLRSTLSDYVPACETMNTSYRTLYSHSSSTSLPTLISNGLHYLHLLRRVCPGR